MTAILEEVRTPASPVPPPAALLPRTFRPDIEGLRAVAVLMVVLYHAGVPWLPGGYIGVDVFFVISGFLITGLLLREYDREGRISIADFYARRARRILPLATVVLLATIGASAIALTTARLGSIARDGMWTAVFGANFRFAASGADYLNATAAPSPLQHYWSLAVEEQFYVVWPLLLWLALHLSRRRSGGNARAAAIAGATLVASLVWSVLQTSSDANAAYFSPFTRAWELAAGALVAICGVTLSRIPRWSAAALGWLGLALIGYGALRFDTATPFPGWAGSAPVVGSVCVLVGGLRLAAGSVEFVLAWPAMQRVGRYSFSLYLWHWPILIIAQSRHPGLGVPAKLGLVAFALAVSAVTYHRLEDPARRARLLTGSVRNSLVMGLALICVALVYANMYVVGGRYEDARAQRAFAAQNAGPPSTGALATSAQIIAEVRRAASVRTIPPDVSPPVGIAARDLSPAYTSGCLVDSAPVTSPTSCVFGDKASTRTVVLLGDSHAAQWLPALTSIASRIPFRIVVLTKHSCPVAAVSTYDGILKRAYTECLTWRTWALDQITALHPALVVASERIQAQVDSSGRQIDQNESIWQQGLAASVATLRGVAGQVVFLSDIAEHAQNTPTCLAANPKQVGRCNDPPSKAVDAAHQSRDAVTVRRAGGAYIDVTPWFCTSVVCPAVVDSKVTSVDGSHLSATYASYLSHALAVEVGIEHDAAATGASATSSSLKRAVAAAAAAKKFASLTPPVAAAAKDLSPAYTDGCLVEAPAVTSPACTFGSTRAGAKSVVLFGDSHAAQWLPALADAATRTDLALTVLTKGNCPAPSMTVYSVEYKRAFTECDDWRTWALAKIRSIKPDLVVLSSTFHGVALADRRMQSADAAAAWTAGLRSTIARIRASGAQVAVIGDVANHATSVPDCVATHLTNLAACATPVLNATLQPRQNADIATARSAGARYVNVQSWFCTAALCPAVVNGIITDFDDSHITATYSTYLGHALGVSLGLER